jgi:GTP pyrophosphokinase
MQIRTQSMHEVAEFGVAAHALYKDGAGLDAFQQESRSYAWLRHTVAMLAQGDTPEEFLEHTKLELFSDQVYCFTPKGKIIALPRKANCIDFAYAVHTDVGNTCVGARINAVMRPLVTELANGDEVQIIVDKTATPSPAWESIVVTGRARSAIRRATKAAIRSQYQGLGRQLLQNYFQRADKPFSDEIIKQGLKRLARPSVEELYWAVGRDEISAGNVLRAVHPDWKGEITGGPKPTEEWFSTSQGGVKFQVPSTGDAIPIRGINLDLPVKFAPNGGAVPGDRIVGIITAGEGITIFPIQSPALAAFDNESDRWLDVRWDIDMTKPVRYPVRLHVNSRNEPGSLARIAQVIADQDGNIDNVRMERKTSDYTDVTIDLEVWDLKHLNAIVSGIKELPMAAGVERVFE